MDVTTTFPLGRPAVADDTAGAVAYLAFYVSGASLTVDGAAAVMG